MEGVTTLRNRIEFGRLVEWSIASHLKCEVPQGTVGSNPTPSAKQKENRCQKIVVVEEVRLVSVSAGMG